MTVTPIHPKSHYGNASDCIVGAFLQALDLKNSAKADHSIDCVFPGAAFEGMMDSVADEAISTDAHAALAIAAAMCRIQEMIDRHSKNDGGLDVYDLVSLDRVRLTLHHLWDVTKKPDELMPIAMHFDLSMPRKAPL